MESPLFGTREHSAGPDYADVGHWFRLAPTFATLSALGRVLRYTLRIGSAWLGASASGLIVAAIDAHGAAGSLASAGDRSASAATLVAADLGVLLPLLAVAVVFALGLMVVEVIEAAPLLAALRRMRMTTRLRIKAAAATPLVVLAFFAWMVTSAHVARAAFGSSTAAATAIGLRLGAAAIGTALACVLVALALFPLLLRGLESVDRASRGLVDPYSTGAAAVLFVLCASTLGVGTGDTGGGGGAPGVGILAVLTRPELDLRPLAMSGVLVTGAYVASLLPLRRALSRGLVGAIAAAAPFFAVTMGLLCVHAARVLDATPALGDALADGAPAGAKGLALLRRLTDHDHDGASRTFGGGDCNDRDPAIGPTMIDTPGNGIDEDCSGSDAELAAPEPTVVTPPVPVARAQARRTYNVIFITVDTLRADLGFAGYPRPITKNLDALAERSTVFEQAYSMASYTAKSVGPMHIGKYPSETLRDWEHFTTYFPANTFVAERVHAAGHRTVGGMCHYYFRWNTGYSQGFDVWDTSAIPQGMADNDTSVTSDRMTDLAEHLLGRPENALPGELPDGRRRRFFAWFHYFDPHLQYVKHPGAPDFAKMPGPTPTRAPYDEEVWFTDQWIGKFLDFVSVQEWARDTAIIITADHGEGFGEHGIIGHGREIWQPLVRIPLILYVPDAEGRKVPQKRSSIDIAPTILDLMGIEAPPGELRGKSLADDVFAAKDAALAERDVYIDMPEGPYNDVRRALVTGPSPGLKLIHFGGSRYRLYDLSVDPDEKNDLAGDKDKLDPVLARMNDLRSRLKEVKVTGEKK
jgi:arylsulfatase A-like enzyme